MAFKWSQIGTAPAPDEIEVTVIGPGFGECIVSHLGEGAWLIVDSCRDSVSGEPVALEYLKALNVAYGQAVVGIVATHWHADHVGGIYQVLDACSAARFYCATVISSREFQVYADVAASGNVAFNDKSAEFLNTLRLAKARGANILQWLQGGQTLHTRPASANSPRLRIMALSPSSAEFTLFLDRISNALGLLAQGQRVLVSSDPNFAAIALLLEWDGGAVLLGADLIAHTALDRGWNAAIDQARNLGAASGSLVKIPHHGSEGAHSDDMWNQLLVQGPNAVITPYASGKKSGRPPKAADLKRISALAKHATLTAPTEAGRARARGSPVAVGTAQHGITVRSRRTDIGLVRYRRRYRETAWQVELFGRAKVI